MLRHGIQAILFTAAILTIPACSVGTYQQSKSNTISNSSVMRTSSNGTVGSGEYPNLNNLPTTDYSNGWGSVPTNVPNNTNIPVTPEVPGSNSGGSTPVTPPPPVYYIPTPTGGMVPGTGGSVPVFRVCTTEANTTPFSEAYSNGYQIMLTVDNKLCSMDANTIRNLIMQSSISYAQLLAICPTIVPASGAFKVDVLINGSSIGKNSTYKAPANALVVLYSPYLSLSSSARSAVKPYCNYVQQPPPPTTTYKPPINENDPGQGAGSPLLIHMQSDVNNPRAIELSSQANGVWFDLLGRNYHKKVRVSWFTNDDYRFLALPNVDGQVLGIDQLFGNNTYYNGSFASDGYAALAKHDTNGDHIIDKRDRVFRKLRVWLDSNRNGIGEENELKSLDQVGITFIDLNYSSDFVETDQYGNQTKMKSVVGRSDGSLDLIFDLWFQYFY